MRNLTLRQKIFISYFILFTLAILLMFPFANYLVKSIIVQSMDDQVSELIDRIRYAQDNEELIQDLKAEKPLIFFRVGIITNEHKILYDSHMKRILGGEFSQEFIVSHPEVEEAFLKGTGYHEDYSERLDQHFAYYAKQFDFHGKTYVLRTAFPFQHIDALLKDFEIGFLLLGSLALLLFSLVTWFAIHLLTRPIEEIIAAIKPYEERETAVIPKIEIKDEIAGDEFSRLASTLNSLSDKVQAQIETLVDERNEKESILQSLGEGVIAVDRNFLVIYANRTALQLLSLQEEQFVGHSMEKASLLELNELLRMSKSEKKPSATSFIKKNGGRVQHLDAVAVPIREQSGFLLVLQDKTAHHRMMQMRKDFVDNASHELKTPITIMMGFAETLHDNPEMPKEMIESVSEKILSNSRRMNNIIQDLLILSDIENLPASRLDELDLLELAERCRNTLLAVFPRTEITIRSELGEDRRIVGDQYLLELALNNLLSNAAKYSEGIPHITLTLKSEKNNVQISVSDLGIGIPEQDLDFLFQRFYTVNKAHSRKLGGSGLGLSIVQTIAEKHQGSISVQSKLGVGSTFTITLPKRRKQ